MNLQAVKILFLKDLFLSRKYLFAYLIAGIACSFLACTPSKTLSFLGFILTMTVAIASGIHLIGTLMLSESTDQTRLFIMSLPVSLLEYSIGKIAVVLTTYLIPWGTMLILTTGLTFIIPDAARGAIIVVPAIFLFLLAGFSLQLVSAVAFESVGATICVMVGCNVLLNVFMMQLFAIPEVAEIVKGDAIIWPPSVVWIVLVELMIVVLSIAFAFAMQTRKRDLV
ncbi:MAG: hypothetical protein ACK5YR_20260 [Pirellula sp.]|jgi:hypothetical protein